MQINEQQQRKSFSNYLQLSQAYSRRNLDNRTGYSDPESRIGRAVKAKDLGYRLHLAVDVKRELPIAMIVVSANENEKKHAARACNIAYKKLQIKAVNKGASQNG